jgi:hypothetical protein
MVRAMKQIVLWSVLVLGVFGSVSCGLARSATQMTGRTLQTLARTVTG